MEHNFSDFCMEEHPQVRAYNNGFESLTVVELIWVTSKSVWIRHRSSLV